MMHIPAFNCWQLSGRDLIVSLGDRFEEFTHLAEKAKKTRGGYLSFDADLPKKIRSTGEGSANHAFNGACQQIAESTGNDFPDVKLAAKRRAFRRGLPYLTRGNGDVVYSLADGEPLPMSEKDMSVEQCGWCIDEAVILAGELGINLRGF
jgi:hypothetical protein